MLLMRTGTVAVGELLYLALQDKFFDKGILFLPAFNTDSCAQHYAPEQMHSSAHVIACGRSYLAPIGCRAILVDRCPVMCFAGFALLPL